MAMKDIKDCEVILAFLESKANNHALGLWPYQILEQKTGQAEKVCFRCMERANNRGFIEYGTSLRSGWVTRQGYAELFDALRRNEIAMSEMMVKNVENIRSRIKIISDSKAVAGVQIDVSTETFVDALVSTSFSTALIEELCTPITKERLMEAAELVGLSELIEWVIYLIKAESKSPFGTVDEFMHFHMREDTNQFVIQNMDLLFTFRTETSNR